MAAVNLGQLQQAIQAGQVVFALIRSLKAAFQAGNPGVELPSDAELIRMLADNSAAGVAETDALIARLGGN
jgi:hypothetical protein